MGPLKDSQTLKGVSSQSVTHDILVKTYSFYIPERSKPDENEFFFAYKINIQNQSDLPVKLLSRYWLVINANGESHEVEGAGVVGKTPILSKNQNFEYTSYCPLDTHWGTMEGYYVFEIEGNQKQVGIKRFFLVANEQAIHG